MARLSLDWLQLVALLGAIQGVFLTVALAAKRSNRTANRVLAVTMFAFSIYLATTVYHAAGYVGVYPHFFGAAHPLPFLYGPLIYLYAVTAADRSRTFGRRDLLHFVPFAVVVIVGLPIYFLSGAEKVALYDGLTRGIVPREIVVENILKLVSGVVYTVATLVFLRRHRDQVKASYSSVERVNLRWLVRMGAAAAVIWLMAIVFQVLEAAGSVVGPGDDIISVAIAVFVYGIGYMGLRQPEVFRFETAEHPIPVELRTSATEPVATDPEPPPPRYERSGLGEREAERLKVALMAAMEKQEPWRDSDLTLADLAEQLSTTPHKLSEVINSQIGQTFYDFVNGYRVREVQRRISAGEAKRFTMLTLALDAGFASKSTFNVVFKKHTNQTPSGFREAVGA
jgi:AraC-like DNA-binding protein